MEFIRNKYLVAFLVLFMVVAGICFIKFLVPVGQDTEAETVLKISDSIRENEGVHFEFSFISLFALLSLSASFLINARLGFLYELEKSFQFTELFCKILKIRSPALQLSIA